MTDKLERMMEVGVVTYLKSIARNLTGSIVKWKWRQHVPTKTLLVYYPAIRYYIPEDRIFQGEI
jgi:hypothetical protein